MDNSGIIVCDSGLPDISDISRADKTGNFSLIIGSNIRRYLAHKDKIDKLFNAVVIDATHSIPELRRMINSGAYNVKNTQPLTQVTHEQVSIAPTSPLRMIKPTKSFLKDINKEQTNTGVFLDTTTPIFAVFEKNLNGPNQIDKTPINHHTIEKPNKLFEIQKQQYIHKLESVIDKMMDQIHNENVSVIIDMASSVVTTSSVGIGVMNNDTVFSSVNNDQTNNMTNILIGVSIVALVILLVLIVLSLYIHKRRNQAQVDRDRMFFPLQVVYNETTEDTEL